MRRVTLALLIIIGSYRISGAPETDDRAYVGLHGTLFALSTKCGRLVIEEWEEAQKGWRASREIDVQGNLIVVSVHDSHTVDMLIERPANTGNIALCELELPLPPAIPVVRIIATRRFDPSQSVAVHHLADGAHIVRIDSEAWRVDGARWRSVMDDPNSIVKSSVLGDWIGVGTGSGLRVYPVTPNARGDIRQRWYGAWTKMVGASLGHWIIVSPLPHAYAWVVRPDLEPDGRFKLPDSSFLPVTDFRDGAVVAAPELGECWAVEGDKVTHLRWKPIGNNDYLVASDSIHWLRVTDGTTVVTPWKAGSVRLERAFPPSLWKIRLAAMARSVGPIVAAIAAVCVVILLFRRLIPEKN